MNWERDRSGIMGKTHLEHETGARNLHAYFFLDSETTPFKSDSRDKGSGIAC